MRHLTDQLGPATAQGPATAAEFADAVRPHMAAMTRLAARIGPNGGQDDVVQEALVRAWRHRARFNAARGSGKGRVCPSEAGVVAVELPSSASDWSYQNWEESKPVD